VVCHLQWKSRTASEHPIARNSSEIDKLARFREVFENDRIYRQVFNEILSGAKRVPSEFSVRISYYHPEAASRVTDEWPVNFAAYQHSMAVRPEIEEQANDISEVLGKLKDEMAVCTRPCKSSPTENSSGTPAKMQFTNNAGANKIPQTNLPQRLDARLAVRAAGLNILPRLPALCRQTAGT